MVACNGQHLGFSFAKIKEKRKITWEYEFTVQNSKDAMDSQ